MIDYEAPAKLNLSLLVHPPDSSGMHPIESLVQTIDLLDRLEFSEADEDSFQCVGADLDPDHNLVVAAIAAVREKGQVPPLAIRLEKSIPLEAGLGGGSADAAAALLGAVELGGLDETLPSELAPEIGADVALFLSGGTQLMTGFGEHLDPQRPLSGFAVAVVVPEFGLSTADVYRRWDEMDGPEGESVERGMLPPVLRDGMPIRNDLFPAALDLEPRLGDFVADVRLVWGSAVLMTGSGAACFGFFGDVDEAGDAASSVGNAPAGFGVGLRNQGVTS
jgi:4-diphosphocytidyl-2-C-methyl-D-erythritol kinase